MSFTEFLDNVLDDRTKDIQVGMIAAIESFDGSTMRADVQPLLKLKNDLDEEIELPILSDLPVLFLNSGGFFIRPFYESGDLVWIGFSTHDFEDALREYSRVASEKTFELHNACVMGSVAKENYTAPVPFSNDGLILGDENFQIIFDGTQLLIGDPLGVHIKFDGTGIYAVTAPGVQFNLLTHQHPTGVGPSGPPTPGT